MMNVDVPDPKTSTSDFRTSLAMHTSAIKVVVRLSLLISLWQHEFPGIEIHFLGISIRDNTNLAPLSLLLQSTLHELRSLFTSYFA
jgi:hypothetical protein